MCPNKSGHGVFTDNEFPLFCNLIFLPCIKQSKGVRIALFSYHVHKRYSNIVIAASSVNTPLFTTAHMANQFHFKFIT